MAQSNTDRVLGWIGLSEGGYVNNPKDPGGATDRGITQRTFDAWNRSRSRPVRPVRGISKEEAEAILVDQYFRPVRFDDLPPGLDYAVVDYAVNSGPARAAADLQRTLGVAADGVDGVIGAQTLAAVRARASTGKLLDLIEDYVERRHQFMRVIKHPTTGARLWDTFGKGWTTRLFGTKPGAQATDIGVLDRATMLVNGITTAIPPPAVAAPGKTVEPPAAAPAEPTNWALLAAAVIAAAVLGGIFF